MRVTATSNATLTNSSSLITFQVIDSNPALGSQILGLIAAIVIGAALLVVKLGGKQIYEKLAQKEEEKEIKAYFEAIDKMYSKNSRLLEATNATPLQLTLIDTSQIFDKEPGYTFILNEELPEIPEMPGF